MNDTLIDFMHALQWLAPPESLDSTLPNRAETTPINAMYILGQNLPGLRAACLNELHAANKNPDAIEHFIIDWIGHNLGHLTDYDATGYINNDGIPLPGYGLETRPNDPEELEVHVDLITFFLHHGLTPIKPTPNNAPLDAVSPLAFAQAPIPDINWAAYHDPNIAPSRSTIVDTEFNPPVLYDIYDEDEYDLFIEHIQAFLPTANLLYHSIMKGTNVDDPQWLYVAATLGWLFGLTDNVCVNHSWEEMQDNGGYFFVDWAKWHQYKEIVEKADEIMNMVEKGSAAIRTDPLVRAHLRYNLRQATILREKLDYLHQIDENVYEEPPTNLTNQLAWPAINLPTIAAKHLGTTPNHTDPLRTGRHPHALRKTAKCSNTPSIQPTYPAHYHKH
jgi:hypothetical protein